ncbi:MAG: response regulator [Gemmatimonadales bacterium]|nr:response regulator [Gemmatimonadales bacterium]
MSKATGTQEPSGPLVLVVDDDLKIRTMLSTILAEQGYRVQSAESGEDALKAMSQELYDVVLLDLELPGNRVSF